MENIKTDILKLKKQKDAVILAHYYVDESVQEIADYVGDSFYLSKIATTIKHSTILFCGVTFMGESAKILNPEKTVIMADEYADCPMAHMVDQERIEEIKSRYEDVAVVCYVNSTADIKARSDVCVTSSNAVKIVKALKNKNIFFIPDYNLGHYVAVKVPEKNIILNDGFCHVHTSINTMELKKLKDIKKNALVLAHPECKAEVLMLADYIGSTSEIIDYATMSKEKEFIICTEMGILYELKQKNPDKKFYFVGHRQFCPNMKRITLEKVKNALETRTPIIELDKKTRETAKKPLIEMLELAKN